MPKQRILVGLDELLDTRAGTLHKLFGTASWFDYTTNPTRDYWDRESDDFGALFKGKITLEQYRNAYKERDISTLKCSLMTNVPLLLGDQTRKIQYDVGRPETDTDGVEVHINTYPYKLSASLEKTLIGVVERYLALSTVVKTVSYTANDLTPTFLDNSYDAMYLYDWDQWDFIHRTAYINTPIPNFTIAFPALCLPGKSFTDPVLRQEDGSYLDPHKLLVMERMDYVFLIPHHPAIFSVLNPNYSFTKSS